MSKDNNIKGLQATVDQLRGDMASVRIKLQDAETSKENARSILAARNTFDARKSKEMLALLKDLESASQEQRAIIKRFRAVIPREGR